MKTAVFGGTFDPVHPGHTAMARYLLASGTADKVLLLPAPQPPHKTGTAGISPYHHRRAMLEMILEPGMEISDLECERSGKSYTFDTLTELVRRHPDGEFLWVIGSDSLRTLHMWHRARELAEKFQFLVFPRGNETVPDERELAQHWPAPLVRKLLNSVLRGAPVMPDSSTSVRGTIRREGIKAAQNMLDPRVWNYIRKHQLYMEKNTYE